MFPFKKKEELKKTQPIPVAVEELRCGWCGFLFQGNVEQRTCLIPTLYEDDDFEEWRGKPREKRRTVDEPVILCLDCEKKHAK